MSLWVSEVVLLIWAHLYSHGHGEQDAWEWLLKDGLTWTHFSSAWLLYLSIRLTWACFHSRESKRERTSSQMLFQNATCVIFAAEPLWSKSHDQAQPQHRTLPQKVDTGRQFPELVKYSATQLIPTSCHKDFSPAYSFIFAIVASEWSTLWILVYLLVEVHLSRHLDHTF